MKKALQISIAQTLFSIEQDAYDRLNTYLESVRAYFGSTSEGQDILSDIEGRIAEQFTESRRTIITISEVDKVIASMGKAEDISGGERAGSEAGAKAIGSAKKLYRDADKAVIGGVAAGFANYFGIDVLWIRLAFMALLFLTTGVAILLYVIAWISIPKAKTPSQKLEMFGSPVNLDTLSETIKTRADEIQTKHSGAIRRLTEKAFNLLRKVFWGVVRAIGPTVRILVAIILTAGPTAAGIGLSVFASILITSSPDRYFDFPITDIAPMAHAYALVGAAYTVILIPLIFAFLAGVSLFRKKSVIRASFTLSLLAVWCVTLIAAGALAFNFGMSYEEYARTNPLLQRQTVAVTVSQAQALKALHGARVTVVTGPAQSLSIQGRKIDIDRAAPRVEGGTLFLGERKATRECLFCEGYGVRYTLTVPSLSALTAEDGSSIDAEIVAPDIRIEAEDGSRVSVSGSATASTIAARYGSSVYADNFRSDNSVAKASEGSHIEVMAVKSLDAVAESGSTIRYYGTATVTESSREGSSIRRAAEGDDWYDY